MQRIALSESGSTWDSRSWELRRSRPRWLVAGGRCSADDCGMGQEPTGLVCELWSRPAHDLCQHGNPHVTIYCQDVAKIR